MNTLAMMVSNKWSRAVFDVGVAYGENVDEAMNVQLALGKEFHEDPKYAGMTLDDMEMLGLDSFGDSAVMIKFFIKTKPLKNQDRFSACTKFRKRGNWRQFAIDAEQPTRNRKPTKTKRFQGSSKSA